MLSLYRNILNALPCEISQKLEFCLKVRGVFVFISADLFVFTKEIFNPLRAVLPLYRNILIKTSTHCFLIHLTCSGTQLTGVMETLLVNGIRKYFIFCLCSITDDYGEVICHKK